MWWPRRRIVAPPRSGVKTNQEGQEMRRPRSFADALSGARRIMRDGVMAMAVTVAVPQGADTGFFDGTDFAGEDRAC